MTDLTENVANEKVQALTEQFNNDELDDRLYYFKQKMSDNVEVGRSFAFNMVRADDGEYLDWFLIDKILAPVPSYEEWYKLNQLLGKCYRFLRLTETKVEAIEKVKRGLVKEIDEVLK